MTVFFIRHGEYDGNVVRDGLTGKSDPRGLNPTGIVQANNVARFFADKEVHALYTSPVARAQHTARVIAQTLELPLTIDERLCEMDYGELEGKSFSQIEKEYGHLRAQWEGSDRFLMQFPAGESFADVFARMESFLQTLQGLYGATDTSCIVVTHSICIHAAVLIATKKPYRDVFALEEQMPIPNASVTKLVFDGSWQVPYAGKKLAHPPRSIVQWLKHRYPDVRAIHQHLGFSKNFVVSFQTQETAMNLKFYATDEEAVANKVAKIHTYLQSHLEVPAKPLLEYFQAPVTSHPFVIATPHIENTRLTADKIRTHATLPTQAAEILHAFHRLPLQETADFWQSQEYPIAVRTPDDWHQFIDHVSGVRIAETATFADLTAHGIAQKAQGWIKQHRDEITASEIAPLHGDYYPSNFCLDTTGKILAVVDFDRSMIGHTMWDLGITRSNAETYYYPEFASRLETAYGVTAQQQQWICLYTLLEFVGSYANNVRQNAAQQDFDRAKALEYAAKLSL